ADVDGVKGGSADLEFRQRRRRPRRGERGQAVSILAFEFGEKPGGVGGGRRRRQPAGLVLAVAGQRAHGLLVKELPSRAPEPLLERRQRRRIAAGVPEPNYIMF